MSPNVERRLSPKLGGYFLIFVVLGVLITAPLMVALDSGEGDVLVTNLPSYNDSTGLSESELAALTIDDEPQTGLVPVVAGPYVEDDAEQPGIVITDAMLAASDIEQQTPGRPGDDDAAAEDASSTIVEPTLLDASVATSLDQVLDLPLIGFEAGGNEPTAEAKVGLRTVADYLKRNPTDIIIASHTDSLGASATNQALSEERAELVRTRLIGLGVDPGLLVSAGVGEADPVDTNDTPEGRDNNRRIEFLIVENLPLFGS